MSTATFAGPQSKTWVAAIHASEHDLEPVGTAVVIDANRVLTCEHVVVSEGAVRQPLWVAFPMAGSSPRRLVASCERASNPSVQDLAMLTLAKPVATGVEAAPLRCPEPGALISHPWWAFGFPGEPLGNDSDGTVGAELAYGWVRLDTSSRYVVAPGFSGAGLWSPDYNAVVAVVGQANPNGDARAITLHQADLIFPGHNLAELARFSVEAAGDVALEQWGWTLARDDEGGRHWIPRARGVSIESERGYRFRGRTAALNRIVQWLDRPKPDRRVLVVTGSPGVGKSAVLGRIVTTADAAIRASLPASDEAARAKVGSVSCAVHAKAKTALEVAGEIARAASAKLPKETGDLAPAVRKALTDRNRSSFNVIIDALDEAASPAQARAIIDKVVLSLAETCTDAGAQVIVGTRRRDGDGDLLGRFGGALAAIDLDDSQYFEEEDLAAYALACLQLAGDERPDSPYAEDALAEPLAQAIARMSNRNFLIAGLTARSHGLYDQQAVDPEQLTFSTTVDKALADYIQNLGSAGGLPATEVLTALAFAEAPGLSADLWQLAVEAVSGTRVSPVDLRRFARSSAGNFLVEASEAAATGQRPDNVKVYRLFHQALNEALLRARSDLVRQADDEKALTRALTQYGRLSRWEDAPSYLLRSLPGHAAAAGLIDDLLGDDAYLLQADLRRLMQVADDATSAQGRGRARLLRLTPQAVSAGAAERVALFSVTEALEDLGTSYREGGSQAPYRASWASVRPRSERAILEGHKEAVAAVCQVTVEGRDLLASAGADWTIRLWDPVTGESLRTLKGHGGWVFALCRVTVAGRDLLASVGVDRTVRIWDPATSEPLRSLNGHGGRVLGVCRVTVADRDLLASAGDDSTVRIWDPATGEQRVILEGHRAEVRAVCPVTVAGRDLLASAGADGTVRIWDPASGEQRVILEGHVNRVLGVCPVTIAGRDLLASAGADGMVRIWDPATGEQRVILEGHRAEVRAVCPVTVAGRDLLASAGADGMVRIWDPATGEQRAALEGHRGEVKAVCPVTVAGRNLLASAGDDKTVRIWDPATGEQRAPQTDDRGEVRAVCLVTVAGRDLLASAGADGMVRIWDPATGEQRSTLEGHRGEVRAVCPVTVAGRDLLASAGADGTVRIWDPATGEQRSTLEGHQLGVRAVCPVTVAGRELLASGSEDGVVRIWDPAKAEQRATLNSGDWITALCPVTVGGRNLLARTTALGIVRIWDPATGEQRATLKGHRRPVRAVCRVAVAGHELLASASDDKTVRIWDPSTGEQRATLEGHQGEVRAVCAVTVAGRDLLASASDDKTVRIWDPETRACLVTVPSYHSALAVAYTADSLAIGLTAGILVVKPTTAL
jgi:WD40 repeat protein